MKHFFVTHLLFVILVALLPWQAMAVSIDELSRAIETAPAERLHSYYVYRSRAYLAMGDEENGFADLESSLQVKPNVEAYLLRGEYFKKTNRLDAAITNYSAALAVNSDCLKAYRLRSVAYYDKKDYAQAVIDASHITLHNEDDPFALNMIEKCYVLASPKEQIILRSNVASVMRARKALLKGSSGKRYVSSPSSRVDKVAVAKTIKKKCGPRRKS